MRTFWSGDLSVGQVVIPLKLATSSKDTEPATVLLHKPCSTRIEQVRQCPECKVPVPWNEIGKGVEISKDKYALLSEEEMKALEGVQGSSIRVLSIVATKLDLLRVEKTYWALPGSKDKKSYILFRDTLTAMDRAACVEAIIRTKPRTAILAPHADVLTLTMLRAPGEVLRHDEESLREQPYSAKESKLARKFLGTLQGDLIEAEKPMQLAREKVVEAAIANSAEPLEDALERSLHDALHPKAQKPKSAR